MGDDSGIKGYDRTKSEQSNAPLLITQDANRVKKNRPFNLRLRLTILSLPKPRI